MKYYSALKSNTILTLAWRTYAEVSQLQSKYWRIPLLCGCDKIIESVERKTR